MIRDKCRDSQCNPGSYSFISRQHARSRLRTTRVPLFHPSIRSHSPRFRSQHRAFFSRLLRRAILSSASAVVFYFYFSRARKREREGETDSRRLRRESEDEEGRVAGYMYTCTNICYLATRLPHPAIEAHARGALDFTRPTESRPKLSKLFGKRFNPFTFIR